MTARDRDAEHLTYQVHVAGVLGPVIRREFADLFASNISVSTVFWLRLDARQGPAEIAAMLHRKGLVLLRARKLGGDQVRRSPQDASPQDAEARPDA